MTAVRVLLESDCDLGEGPHWDEREELLVWVDINRGRVLRWPLGAAVPTALDLGQPVGAVVPRARGGVVAALRDGVAAVDEAGGLDWLGDLRGAEPRHRFNDARCDARGRLWAGSVARKFGSEPGTLYRLEPDGDLEPVVRDVAFCNGLGWSPDGSVFYLIDSLAPALLAFPFDLDTGELGRPEVLAAFDAADGLPDGLAVDAAGDIWIARYGGAALERWGPDGVRRARIPLPARQPTCPGFAGPGLDRLVVTTAAQELDAAQRTAADGAVLEVTGHGARGLLVRAFAG